MVDLEGRILCLGLLVVLVGFCEARCYGKDALGTCTKIKNNTFQFQDVIIDQSSRFRRQANQLPQNYLRGNVNPNYGRQPPIVTPAVPFQQQQPPARQIPRQRNPPNQPPRSQRPVSGGYDDLGSPQITPSGYDGPSPRRPSKPRRPNQNRNPSNYDETGQANGSSTVSKKRKGSRWGNNIHANGGSAAGGAFAGTQNAKYSYPPKAKLPLSSCFYNPSGYVCCNQELNNVMVDTVKELLADPKFSSCNIGAINAAVQQKSEDRFNTPFEAVTGFSDFAQTIHFSSDLACKIEVDGKVIMSYATPYNAENAVEPLDNPPPIFPSAKLRI
uniref:Ground-like domain-containing protein n=1 Tax=Panagrellus redivivus TaxID=6233 RepID=A0A7E4UMI7_PANRE